MRLPSIVGAMVMVVMPVSSPSTAAGASESASLVASVIPACALCDTFEYMGVNYVEYTEGCFDTENCSWCPNDEPCWDTQWELDPGEDPETFCWETRCEANRLALAIDAATAIANSQLAAIRSYMVQTPGVMTVSVDERTLEIVSCDGLGAVARISLPARMARELIEGSGEL